MLIRKEEGQTTDTPFPASKSLSISFGSLRRKVNILCSSIFMNYSEKAKVEVESDWEWGEIKFEFAGGTLLM